MLNKIIKILLVLLFFLLPLINSHLIDLFWIKWGFYVDWNYEFTKLMFFNVFSWLILTLFFIKNNPLLNFLLWKRSKAINKLIIPKIVIPIIFILFLSTIFSEFWYISLFWNISKWHSLLMFLNLLWLFILFINQGKDFRKKLIFTTIISSIFVWILWIKEYYFPTFDYWNLSNRALSTFWHPNYLVLYILILIPFILSKQFILSKFIRWITWLILIFLLFLTKSVWWIFIFLIYILFLIFNKNKEKIKKKYLIIFIIFWVAILWIVIYNFWLITKLNSFISRFYIWETTLKIIFSDLKHFIFWYWLSTLDLYFDSFKVKELFIFENIGFTADRPHNLILNIFYNFWFLWLSLLVYIFYSFIKNIKNNNFYHSIILFLIFTIFNFSSISVYLILILIISLIYKEKNDINNIFIKNIIILIIFITTIFWIYISIINYNDQYLKYINPNYISNNYFIKKQNLNLDTYKNNLSVIQLFSLWDLYRENNDKIKAKEYYKEWLAKLPDMWNENSKYYDNYLIKNIFTPARFYSEKFSNLKEVLKRVWDK